MVIVYLTSLFFPLLFAFLYFILGTGSHYVASVWPGACYVDQAVPLCEMKGMHHYGQPFQHLLGICIHSFLYWCACVSV